MMTARSWEYDKRFSDRYLDEIKSILGVYLIGEPPVEEDEQRNTDLIVLRMEAVRIGCRIRRHHYLHRYADEFTIRSGRPSGVKTEITKIIEGWGDYFFYGFENETGTGLARWTLADLNVFRIWHSRQLYQSGGVMPGVAQANGDGSSAFRAFRWSQLPRDLVVATSHPAAADLFSSHQIPARRAAG